MGTTCRSNPNFCKSGEHEWIPENIIYKRGYPLCVICLRRNQREWRQRTYKSVMNGAVIGPYKFYIPKEKIDRFISICFTGQSIKNTAQVVGISPVTGYKLWRAERFRRQMAAQAKYGPL